jgi:hypothetical protein
VKISDGISHGARILPPGLASGDKNGLSEKWLKKKSVPARGDDWDAWEAPPAEQHRRVLFLSAATLPPITRLAFAYQYSQILAPLDSRSIEGHFCAGKPLARLVSSGQHGLHANTHDGHSRDDLNESHDSGGPGISGFQRESDYQRRSRAMCSHHEPV